MKNKVLIPFIAAFVLLIVVIVLNRITFAAMQNDKEWVSHSRDVIISFNRLSDHLKSAEVYTPTYLNIPEKRFYQFYKNDLDSINSDIFDLKHLVIDNREQTFLVDSIDKLIVLQLPTLSQKNIAEIIAAGEGWRIDKMFIVHDLINKGIVREQLLLNQRTVERDRSTSLNNFLSFLLGLFAVLIIVFTFLSNLFVQKKNIWLEDFLESILNTSQDGIIHYKAVKQKGKILNFKVEFANRAVERLLGKDPKKIIGKTLDEFISHIKRARLFDKYVHVVESGQQAEIELSYSLNNEERWFYLSLIRLNDGVTATFHDITSLKKYEQELKEKISQLERSNLELEQYAYAASHDLQEPLRKLKTFGSFLQETQLKNFDEKGQQHLSKMLLAADRMSGLINDLLNFSGLRKQDQYTPTDLNEVLNNVLFDLELAISQKKALIKSDNLPVIDAIPLQMNQLFYNIINNALKFAKENFQPFITISCKEVDRKQLNFEGILDEEKYFQITFQDNGVGFNQDYADQIFGLFKRLHDRRVYTGSGIGLALCKKVVQNHHGEIRADGKENEGAAFYVYLPEHQDIFHS